MTTSNFKNWSLGETTSFPRGCEINFHSFKGVVEAHFLRQKPLGSLLLNGTKVSSSASSHFILNATTGAFRQATPLTSKQNRLLSPHMVFREPGRNSETERHLFRSRTLTLCKTACLYLWPKKSKQAKWLVQTLPVFQENSYHPQHAVTFKLPLYLKICKNVEFHRSFFQSSVQNTETDQR